jgi:glycosyltransferase involved in cell wall biosynthesis
MSTPSLTVGFCTRDRPAELRRAAESLLACAPEARGVAVELLVIDDGHLEPDLLSELANSANREGWTLGYRNKRDRAGLIRSRVETVSLAKHDVILFLDDDIELERGYLEALLATYRDSPDLAGLGGVDLLSRPGPGWRRSYEYLIGYRSPGLAVYRSAAMAAA